MLSVRKIKGQCLRGHKTFEGKVFFINTFLVSMLYASPNLWGSKISGRDFCGGQMKYRTEAEIFSIFITTVKWDQGASNEDFFILFFK